MYIYIYTTYTIYVAVADALAAAPTAGSAEGGRNIRPFSSNFVVTAQWMPAVDTLDAQYQHI